MKEPRFFATQSELRKWFQTHHQTETEIWIGYYKKATGIPSIDWPQSVDEAICFGWIDGIRRKIDEKSYKIRFTPRNPKSHWSAVNLAKVEKLLELGLMMPAGLEVYHKRDEKKSKQASYERQHIELDQQYEAKIRQNEKAWLYFENLAASYKKASIHWVMSAKNEGTRLRRLEILIQSCETEQKIPLLRRKGE